MEVCDLCASESHRDIHQAVKSDEHCHVDYLHGEAQILLIDLNIQYTQLSYIKYTPIHAL